MTVERKIYGTGTLHDSMGKVLFTEIDCSISLPADELGMIRVMAYRAPHLRFSGEAYRLTVSSENTTCEIEVLLVKRRYSKNDYQRYDFTFIANEMTTIEGISETDLPAQVEELVYYLSPYHEIPMRYINESKYTGQITHDFINTDDLKFELPGLGVLQFEKRFSSKSIDAAFDTDEMVGFPVGRLTLNVPIRLSDNENLVEIIKKKINPKIDYILSIIGFMNERRVSWHKFQVCINRSVYTYYRNTPDVATFIRGKDRETCIPQWEFSAFLKNAIERLSDSPYRYRMKVAFDTIARKNTSEVNISAEMYLSLFSAVEGLLLIYRRLAKKEYIVSGNQWKKIHHVLHEAIKDFKCTEKQKEAMTAKLPELNRYSLKDAWVQFISNNSIDTDCLWPIFAVGKDKPGLSDIRNLLIHGENANFSSLYMYAQDHIQLLLERIICYLLHWPLERTNISNEKVKNCYIAVQQLPEILEQSKVKYEEIQNEIRGRK